MGSGSKWLISSSDLNITADVNDTDLQSQNVSTENSNSKQWHFHMSQRGKFESKQQVLLYKSGCARDPLTYSRATLRKIEEMMLLKNVNIVCFLGT